jgi:hypothetical protein
MPNKYEEAIDQVVFAVSALWFGDAEGSGTDRQRLVRAALDQKGILTVIRALDPHQ